MYFPQWVLTVFFISGTVVVGGSALFLVLTFIKELCSEEGAF
jgi:hypothetical protein